VVSHNPYMTDESWKTGSSAKRERVDMYLEWLLTPEPLRVPKTKKALAELLGVDPSTLYKYEREDRFQREFLRRRRGLIKVEDADRIIKAQVIIATDPGAKNSTQAARFLFDWMEKTSDRQDQGVDLSVLTEEELLELVNEYLNHNKSD
jgi:transcriptional regulator with XRE-family HTH domain